ncbi:MAG TPA: DUF1353 domain-containing protein [Gammaproteobacteria bacterium]|nr:DUF1353 domain-containing protein [Gammaproteobacteria bacterium]
MGIVQAFLVVIGLSLALYFIMSFFYEHLLKKAVPHLAPDNMPELQPLPIPTKHLPGSVRKILAGLFGVRQWRVLENREYKINAGTAVVMPKGFVCDGASIPRPLWALLSPTGLLLIPGLLHDYGYKYDML